MVNKATGLSLAPFNEEFIYKFGGRIDALTKVILLMIIISKDCDIERYDLARNQWTIVNLT